MAPSGGPVVVHLRCRPHRWTSRLPRTQQVLVNARSCPTGRLTSIGSAPEVLQFGVVTLTTAAVYDEIGVLGGAVRGEVTVLGTPPFIEVLLDNLTVPVKCPLPAQRFRCGDEHR